MYHVIFEKNHVDNDFLSLNVMRAKTLNLRDEYAGLVEDIGDLRVGRINAPESRDYARKLKKDLSPGGPLRVR